MNRRTWAAAAIAITAALAGGVSAQRGGPPGPPLTPRQNAPIDLTGTWVAVVTEDWRWRMVTPPKGDVASVPVNGEGRKAALAWSLEADNAVLHDSIDNASKLLGDDYLARLYRTAAERFHFDEWDASIERKLGVLHGIYAKLEDVAGRRRAEVLEWLIIALIAVEILLSLWPKG